MTGVLALVGGNELGPGNEPQDRLLVEAANGGPAYVVASAAAGERPELAVRHAKAWFEDLGLEVTELRARSRHEAREPAIAQLAAAGRFFYLVGGDPRRVPDALGGSPVWDAIVGAWRAGASLAGSSAGAMALGSWTLLPGRGARRSAPGLGLVPGIAVIPHLGSFGKGWVSDARRELPDAVLLGIDEATAAVWRDGGWTAMGAGGVTVWRDGGSRRYAAGDAIDGVPAPG